MEFTSLFPPSSRKPRSSIAASFNPKHPITSVFTQNNIRGQFSIITWLCIGAFLQCLLVLLPVPLFFALAPSVALLSCKIINVLLVLYKLKANPLMKGVIPGRHSAIFPASDGSFKREAGSTVGGGGMVVFLLGSRTNNPLGILSPNFRKLAGYFTTMFRDLETHTDEWGFLGGSSFANVSDRTTQSEGVNLMYFRSIEDLHAFAHGPFHRAGWDWFSKNARQLDDIAISHEVYIVPEGGFENIYNNYAPSNFAATSHLIRENGGMKQWARPVVDGNVKALQSSAGRIGVVKGK